jgi:DNA-binding MarR family transcriptional regulator
VATKRSVLIELTIANALASQLFDRELEESGLVPGQFGVLTALFHAGPSTPTRLEQETGMAPSTLRERLGALHAAGYIARRPNPADGRSYYLEVTPAGRRFLKEARPALARLERRLAKALGRPLEDYREPLEELRRAEQKLLEVGTSLVREGPDTAVTFP